MRRPTRRAAAVSATALLAATVVATTAQSAPGQAAPAQAAPAKSAPAQSSATSQTLADPHPAMAMVKATDSVELPKYGRSVYLDLGVYAVAGDIPFEVRAHRTDYREPIHAELVLPTGNITMPDGTVRSFRGLAKFFSLQIRDRAGKLVVDRTRALCPGYDTVRVRPDTPTDRSTYPLECPWNPFTRGAVYGIDPGWGVSALSPYGSRAQLALGRYTATLTINEPYRTLLGITGTDATATVKMHVVRATDSCRGCKHASRSGADARSAIPRRPAAKAPTGQLAVPGPESMPDLQSLPAYAVGLGRRGYLSFAATVWNAGPSPLVVDGFRRSDEAVMDAYQYFYEADGTPVGYEPAGTMEWDDRSGHNHWHFRDFARYRLLDADKNNVVRSHKEAFCLANTDAVDYTVPGANWRPFNTDLHTSCGGFTSLSVREVLDAGSGDTYFQYLPGQSFNVKNLPNGKYFIAVEANPMGVLHEADTTNNVSYRKVFLRGSGDHRRVVVPAVGLINEGGDFIH